MSRFVLEEFGQDIKAVKRPGLCRLRRGMARCPSRRDPQIDKWTEGVLMIAFAGEGNKPTVVEPCKPLKACLPGRFST